MLSRTVEFRLLPEFECGEMIVDVRKRLLHCYAPANKLLKNPLNGQKMPPWLIWKISLSSFPGSEVVAKASCEARDSRAPAALSGVDRRIACGQYWRVAKFNGHLNGT